MIRLALLGLVGLALGADDPLAGRVAGAAQDCIDPRGIGPEIVRDGRLIYRPTRGVWFVSQPPDACPSLRPNATLIVEMYGSRLCRNDRFRVRNGDEIIPSAYCRFGAFVPYAKGR